MQSADSDDEQLHQTRLQAIIGDRKPSITVNGSEKSVLSLIEATEPGQKGDMGPAVNPGAAVDNKSTTGTSLPAQYSYNHTVVIHY